MSFQIVVSVIFLRLTSLAPSRHVDSPKNSLSLHEAMCSSRRNSAFALGPQSQNYKNKSRFALLSLRDISCPVPRERAAQRPHPWPALLIIHNHRSTTPPQGHRQMRQRGILRQKVKGIAFSLSADRFVINASCVIASGRSRPFSAWQRRPHCRHSNSRGACSQATTSSSTSSGANAQSQIVMPSFPLHSSS